MKSSIQKSFLFVLKGQKKVNDVKEITASPSATKVVDRDKLQKDVLESLERKGLLKRY